MPISAGILTEIVTLQKTTVSYNEANEQMLSYADIAQTRANVKFTKGQRVMTMGDIWNPSSIVVTVRYSETFSKASRVIWQDKTYIVISNNGDRINRTMTITCDLADEGQEPEESTD